jgi:hypothetical protein
MIEEPPTHQRRRFPTGPVLITLILGASLLVVSLGRNRLQAIKQSPAPLQILVEVDPNRPVTSRGPSGHKAVNFPRGRAVPAARGAKLLPLDPNYTAPAGVSWHRAALEKSPDDWLAEHGGALPLADREEMLAYFRHTTNLTVRTALISAMMLQMGGEDLALAVNFAVTNDYRKLTVSSDDATLMHNLYGTLRWAAGISPVTFEMVREAVDFEYWEQNRPFVRAVDEDGKEDRWQLTVFSGEAVKALGFTGDPRVPGILQGLRNRDINYTYYNVGAIVDAVFIHDVAKKVGQDGFEPPGSLSVEAFQRWISDTPNGKQWWEWSESVRKQRPTIKRD